MAAVAGLHLRALSSPLAWGPGDLLTVTVEGSLQPARQLGVAPHLSGGAPCRERAGERFEDTCLRSGGKLAKQFAHALLLISFRQPPKPRKLSAEKTGHEVGLIPYDVTQKVRREGHALLAGNEATEARQDKILLVPAFQQDVPFVELRKDSARPSKERAVREGRRLHARHVIRTSADRRYVAAGVVEQAP